MPIANCILSPNAPDKSISSVNMIELWGKHCGLDTSEMTVTVVRGEAQFGKEYLAVCSLNLPTIWSSKSISLLQLGLSSAISEYFGLDASKVIVMTSLIESGYVVEGGSEIKW
ncbi:TPA: hypothetical protein NJ564_004558 [Vibrio parahaemolyticus]|nr:hypothetical protein [Vibrio parahaemolyticus]